MREAADMPGRLVVVWKCELLPRGVMGNKLMAERDGRAEARKAGLAAV